MSWLIFSQQPNILSARTLEIRYQFSNALAHNNNYQFFSPVSLPGWRGFLFLAAEKTKALHRQSFDR
ncbi:hypothetical protein RZY48_002883 [Vibrio navarrensis]|uniref:Uncharacterized protein n=1 Tax=Vibrio navarrensis TaxID=29495 RepID=A0AAI9CVQ6_9VIBR|nr:hypothetical protein [Vibrio navarrensis]